MMKQSANIHDNTSSTQWKREKEEEGKKNIASGQMFVIHLSMQLQIKRSESII